MRRVSARRLVLLAGGALLAASLGLALHRASRTAADCARLFGREERAACRTSLGLAPDDDLAAVRELIRHTTDPTERDLLLLSLVMDDPRRGRWGCPQVTDARMKAWCLDVQWRTHLLSDPD